MAGLRSLAHFLSESLIFSAAWLSNGRPIRSKNPASRFAFEKSKLRPTKAHFRLFVPDNEYPDELSVSLLGTLTAEAGWAIGDKAGKRRGKRAIAKADLMPHIVRQRNLDLVHNVPPCRHAIIVGWPNIAQVEERKQLAVDLSEAAKLVRRPGTNE